MSATPAYRAAYARINGLARRLLAPLHEQFLEAEHQGDLVSCLVIQGLIIECFAVAAYRLYLPVAVGVTTAFSP